MRARRGLLLRGEGGVGGGLHSPPGYVLNYQTSPRMGNRGKHSKSLTISDSSDRPAYILERSPLESTRFITPMRQSTHISMDRSYSHQ